ncbi:CPBP family intramembrane glutamic endopeptidase [Pedobacter sp. MC2016-24]|uniref:CPBP family intramembrane glutamic endopeptidase n=1 Tax=Pedobacter sp. MC2016-24 TaxID=2780090 RepID=UPI00187EA3BC|nr:CPBP family intramembrane glutamic endopeptidase [Pedobacter sp. MC2016-24]MBE9598618.1 CPBP family intramembrane metalloprotease [Pedobacter sp. MC2016-24]
MSLFTPLIWILMILPMITIAMIQSQKGQLKYLAFFVLYFLFDCYLQQLSGTYLKLDFLGLQFSWIGKILSLITSVAIIYSVSKADRQAIGLTTKTNAKKQLKFGLLFFFGLLLFDFIFKIILFPKGGSFHFETFAFQASMPGLTEELAFRGIGCWLLDKAFVPRWTFKGVQFGWGIVIVTVFFGIAHGVVLTENHELKFDLVTIIYLTLISSASLGMLRKFSGNLIYPILGHNTINIMNSIIRIL